MAFSYLALLLILPGTASFPLNLFIARIMNAALKHWTCSLASMLNYTYFLTAWDCFGRENYQIGLKSVHPGVNCVEVARLPLFI